MESTELKDLSSPVCMGSPCIWSPAGLSLSERAAFAVVYPGRCCTSEAFCSGLCQAGPHTSQLVTIASNSSDSYSVPQDFSAPLELPQEHFGLVDDYGIKPKQPRSRPSVARERPAGLRRAGKSKRDELDLLEYYYNARL
ncbi:protein Frey 1 isoform 1-T1 [Podargus strigoides]